MIGHGMDQRRGSLIVEPGPDDMEVSVAALDCEYHSVQLLRHRPGIFRLELWNSTRSVGWDPQGEELSWAGRTFSELLHALYDGRHWRLSLYLSLHLMVNYRERGHPTGPDDSGPPWGWFVERMREQDLSMAFWLTEPWCLHTIDDAPQADPDEYRWYHWWCPKAALTKTLTKAWDWNCKGYLASRSGLNRLEECFSVENFADRLDRILDTCKFVFQGANHGSQMVILSRTLSLAEVRAAARHPSVRRALRGLSIAASASSTMDTG